MRINLSNSGKRFNREWIFKDINYCFLPGHHYAITGLNGSGKSTLLQVLAGSMDISEGKITWHYNENLINGDEIFKYLTITAPYIEIIEELTGFEFFKFHKKFKPLLKGISIKEILQIIGLQKAGEKQIRYYSSGMKQRIKLAQAIFSDVPLLLLDEPCTNFDVDGFNLYSQLIADFTTGKTIIVSSNDPNEFLFCKNVINVASFKN